jgi:hypothetical protein
MEVQNLLSSVGRHGRRHIRFSFFFANSGKESIRSLLRRAAMALTVSDLRDMLEGLDDNLEVRFAAQPNWPFEYSIDKVEVVNPNAPSDDEEREYEDALYEARQIEDPEKREAEIKELRDGWIAMQESNEADNVLEVVYLVEGNQIGYLPGIVASAIGWGRG